MDIRELEESIWTNEQERKNVSEWVRAGKKKWVSRGDGGRGGEDWVMELRCHINLIIS